MREWLRKIPPIARVLLGTLIAIVVLAISKPSAPTQPAGEHPARVRYMVAQPASHAPQIQLFGRIQSPRDAQLTAVVTANVDRIPVRAGNRVAKGDLLIQLDDSEVTLARDRAKAARDEAAAQLETTRLRAQSDREALKLEEKLTKLSRQNYQRLLSLKDKKLISQTQLDQASENLARAELSLTQRQLTVKDSANELARVQARLASAQAQLEQAELDLKRTRVEAPFSGSITDVSVAPGERVRPGEPLVSLYADQDLEVRAQIPERYLPAVREGLKQGPLDARTELEGQTHPLSLTRLAASAVSSRGGIDGLFSFDRGTPATALGRPLSIVLTLPARPDLLALPASALHGLDRLYRIGDQGHLEREEAHIVGEALEGPDPLLLLSAPGIHAGDHVMITQLPQAIAGLPVDARPQASEDDSDAPAGQENGGE
ncbi:multidrug resistance protein [Alcanivorax hongdengensis A-11-3]|uniref:Multidrug resistance protein n=1 Tax=Alcanivorax hongdengensis A-11-3 TaxID=1177179 RepID=L0WEZ2_9GAMM|nr:HlyD family efflux transporter periplasmic adaptor subunit [Alcanivorax hongdengensis]EKF74737.1 multidrug resistance protein [Alcanivorax hongdengensis A-11-3]